MYLSCHFEGGIIGQDDGIQSTMTISLTSPAWILCMGQEQDGCCDSSPVEAPATASFLVSNKGDKEGEQRQREARSYRKKLQCPNSQHAE